MYKTRAYSAASAKSALASAAIPRREPKEGDVQIEILFCGVCHSDLHQGARRVATASCPLFTPASPVTRSWTLRRSDRPLRNSKPVISLR